MDYHLQIVLILTIGFALASLFSYIMQRIKFPSILGYLLAGFAIGPYSPGFVADPALSDQLANIGVILMLFGVGLHFTINDLISVKNIAIPGAIGQTVISAACTLLIVYAFGWPIEYGIIMGLAIGVASTVVLVRMLVDHNLVNTTEGHIAIGWLVLEDLFTIIILILLPLLADFFNGSPFSMTLVAETVGLMIVKFALLALIALTWGQKFVGYVLNSVARLRSQELFTITLLSLIFIIATLSSFLFGTSIALGAFIAGMIIGQTDVRHQAAANALPIKDIFVVFFFISVGMLFNPSAIMDHFAISMGILAVILLIKPIAAFLIVIAFRYPVKTALIIAIALAQIGEFSFILAEEAMHLDLLPAYGFNILVACAVISISLNPLLFSLIDPVHAKIQSVQAVHMIKAKVLRDLPKTMPRLFELYKPDLTSAIIVGFGHIGKEAYSALLDMKCKPIVIENNIDIVTQLKEERKEAIYGDATLPEILEVAQILKAKAMVITISNLEKTIEIISAYYSKLEISAFLQFRNFRI